MPELSDENLERLLIARANVENIHSSLNPVVDPASISYKAKIPYKAMVYREAVLWRSEELARCACDLIERGDVCTAILSVRALTENAVGLVYLADFLAGQVERGLDGDADDRVMSLLMGHKNWEEMPQAINILTMLKKAEKVAPGISEVYANLCEFAHPNWSGTSGLFAKHDPEQVLTNFGRYPRGIDLPAKTALVAMLDAIEVLIYAYNKAADFLPDFITLCERALPDGLST